MTPIQLPSPINFLSPSAPGFVAALNKFIQQTVTALSALQGKRTEFKALTVSTDAGGDVGQLPIAFDNPLPSRPIDVHVAQVFPDSNAVLLGAPGVAWRVTSGGQVQVTALYGLDVSSSYVVNLSVS